MWTANNNEHSGCGEAKKRPEKAVIEGHVVYNKMVGHLCYTGIQFDEEITKTNQPSLCEHIDRHLQHQP
jgi:hypothetical protein